MPIRAKKITIVFFIGIFIMASFLRIYLAAVNRDANDNHFKVIRIIANENRIPDKEELECLQCYHPKLYHFVAAKMINLFSASSTDMTDEQKIISQLINAFAGILTLIIIYKFLGKLALFGPTRIITFSLVALNPALIGINAQATNDSFVILFSTAALYFFYSFLKERTIGSFLLMALSVILASLSKGSGLIIFLGIIVIFILKIISSYNNRTELKKCALFFAALASISIFFISVFGPYDEYYEKYESLFVINKPVSALPHFFAKTYEGDKTAVISIADSYLTFRFFDLLQHPYLNRETDVEKYSSNRSSLWTQLYARSNFIQFEGHPTKWFVKISNPIYKMGKIIFVFALVPLVIFLYGIFLISKKTFLDLKRRGLSFLSGENEWIFLFFFSVFIFFIIKFTLDYRDFTSMKPIYLFPGLLAFVYIFSTGFEAIYERIKKSVSLRYGLNILIGILLVLYSLDIAHLIKKLS